MRYLMLILALAICSNRLSAQEATTTTTQVTSNPVKQWTSNFTAIDVDAPIKLKLIKIGENEAPYIIYDTKGSYTSKFTAEADKSGTLKIRERSEAKRETITEVEVYFNNLSDIIISKADVSVEGVLDSPLLDIRVSNNAHFVADVNVLDLMISVTGKCCAVLNGEALYQTADVSSAEYNAAGLQTISTVVSSSHGAFVKVDAKQRLEAKTSTGGEIRYKSHPEIFRSEIPMFGGEIKML